MKEASRLGLDANKFADGGCVIPQCAWYADHRLDTAHVHFEMKGFDCVQRSQDMQKLETKSGAGMTRA